MAPIDSSSSCTLYTRCSTYKFLDHGYRLVKQFDRYVHLCSVLLYLYFKSDCIAKSEQRVNGRILKLLYM